MSTQDFAMLALAAAAAALVAVEAARLLIHRPRAAARLGLVRNATTVWQADDETFHVTLARDDDGYEYKLLRVWTMDARDDAGRRNNDDEVAQLVADGWEPAAVGGAAAGAWGRDHLFVFPCLFRRPKGEE